MSKKIMIMIGISLFVYACTNTKKSQKGLQEIALPVFYEITSSGRELNKSEVKQYRSIIEESFKKKNIRIITEEEATGLLKKEIQKIFDSYDNKDLGQEKNKMEAAKKMNQIPSVAKKVSLKIFRSNEEIDSLYIVSGLFTNILERKERDSLIFINHSQLSKNIFLNETIDSCNKKNLFK